MRDGTDDAPLDLGVVGPAGDGPGADHGGDDGGSGGPAGARSQAWRRWAFLAAGVAVGAALAAVVVDARHDAAELARVGIVSGPTNWIPAEENSGGARVDLQLMNIGSRPVEIIDVVADGFRVAPGTEPFEAVEAPVGDWIVVEHQGLVADCEGGDRPTSVRVRIRDADGDERTVVAEQNDNYGSIGMYWSSECDFNGGYVGFVQPVTVTPGDAAVTVTTPLLNYAARPVRVTHLVPMAPGMTASTPELPIDLDSHGTAQVEVTWTVDDCAEATTMAGDAGLIEFTVASGTTQRPEMYPLDATTMVELVRLASRVCDA